MCDSSSATKIVFSSPLLIISPWFPSRPSSLAQIELEAETAPLAYFAFERHSPAMHRLDDVLHERQPEPGSLSHVLVRLDAIELIKHKGQILWRDAHPGVAHAARHLFPRLVDGGFNRDSPAVGGVFHGITKQVEDPLVEHVAIGDRLMNHGRKPLFNDDVLPRR